MFVFFLLFVCLDLEAGWISTKTLKNFNFPHMEQDRGRDSFVAPFVQIFGCFGENLDTFF